MLLQAKALTTAAEWAQAYAKLAKEKDAQLAALAKENRILRNEKDALAKVKDGVAKEKDERTKERDALAKEKDELANQLAAAISQCTALRNSTRLLCTLVVLVCEALWCRSAHSFCAHCCDCDVCSCSGGRCRSRDAAEASSRSRCRARAETRPLSSIVGTRQFATYRMAGRHAPPC
jgi:hypothetical protein